MTLLFTAFIASNILPNAVKFGYIYRRNGGEYVDHEHDNWPDFTLNAKVLASKLADVRHQQGRLLGRMGRGWALTCAAKPALIRSPAML